MQVLCAQCGYQQIAQATYVGPMCTMWVPTNCPNNLCRPYVHNVGTNKLPMQPMQALCAQCEYQQIAHATYVGPMCTMCVPTNCPSNLCRLYVHNVSTNKLPKQPMQAPRFTMWVPTNCPCNLCRLYVHNVSTNKLPMQPMQPLCSQCWYQQIAHATYGAPMFTMWVPTNCPCNLCRLYVHNVGSNKLPMQPMQALCAQCEYKQIAHATYVGSMCTM